MLSALADPILPVFAVLAVGILLRRARLFQPADAVAANRFVFYLAAPALVFAIVARAPFGALYWPAMGIYVAAELAIYVSVALLAHRVFRRPAAEALLLGMAACFSNHVFFVRPIAVLLYGPDAADPIAAIILADALVFSLSVFAMDALAAGRANLTAVAGSLLRNPFVYAPVLGFLYWLAADIAPAGVMTFADFAGAAASPVSLFALGVVLAGIGSGWAAPILLIALVAKLAVHPGLVWLGIGLMPDVPSEGWQHLPVLVAAGPAGAMPFVIATQYGVSTDLIARLVLVSTLLSVVTLSLLS